MTDTVTASDLKGMLVDHEKQDDDRFEELVKLIRPISEEIVGDSKTAGMRERLRVLERTVQNAKWIIGILFGGTGVLMLDKVMTWINTHGVPHP